MPILGAHMSIAGGYYRAVEQAAAIGCDCVQLFTKNNNQWRAKPISDDEAGKFQEAYASAGLSGALSHASYLINLGSPDDELWQKSIDALVVELDRATQLGIPDVVFHPGSFTTSSAPEGLVRISQAIDQVHKKTDPDGAKLLLENTAGQGSNLGFEFSQLAEIMNGVQDPRRLAVCIDTCHAFAAGYAMDSTENYKATLQKLDDAIGLKQVHAFHLNDSKTPFGSRKDRHESIGQGEMGSEPFRHLLNDSRFDTVPMYLETPKKGDDGEDLDPVNLKALRDLVKA